VVIFCTWILQLGILQLSPLASRLGVVGGTSTSSSSSFPSPQPSTSQLSPWPLPLLLFLLSELHAQPNVTSLLLPVEGEAATPPCVSTVFLVAVFQALQHHFVKYWRRWEKT